MGTFIVQAVHSIYIVIVSSGCQGDIGTWSVFIGSRGGNSGWMMIRSFLGFSAV